MQMKSIQKKLKECNGDLAAVEAFMGTIQYSKTVDRAIQALDELGLPYEFVAAMAKNKQRTSGIQRPQTMQILVDEVLQDYRALGPEKQLHGRKEYGWGLEGDKYAWLFTTPISPGLTLAMAKQAQACFKWYTDGAQRAITKLEQRGSSGVEFDIREVTDETELANVTGTKVLNTELALTARDLIDQTRAKGLSGRMLGQIAANHRILKELGKELIRDSKKGADAVALEAFLHMPASYVYALAWPKQFWEHAMKVLDKPTGIMAQQFVVEYWEKRKMPYAFWAWMARTDVRSARQCVYGVLEGLGVKITIGPAPEVAQ